MTMRTALPFWNEEKYLSPEEKLNAAKKNHAMLGNIKCYGEIQKVHGRKDCFVWASDDELKMAIDQPFIETNDVFGFDYKSTNPLKTNPFSERDRCVWMLQNRLKRKAEALNLKIHNGKKPCRMKACGGVTHAQDEKCPTMAALGKRGGKSGTGASKARKGDNNGRTKRRQCCGTMYRSPHNLTCSKAKITLRKDADKIKIRNIRKEAIIKRTIDWSGFAVPPHILGKALLRSIHGKCGGCEIEMPARKAERIHRADLVAGKKDARLICGGCV